MKTILTTAVLVLALGAPAFAICGDVTGEGDVTVSDALRVLHRVVGIDTPITCNTVLATGDTVDYGPASDGRHQVGIQTRYTDNSDGTITDHATGLMWEKKSDDFYSVHYYRGEYTFSDERQCGYTGQYCHDDEHWQHRVGAMTGTLWSEFLWELNGGPHLPLPANCFAGYCDWRIPNALEVNSLLRSTSTGVYDQDTRWGWAVDDVFKKSHLDNQGSCTCDDITDPDCSCFSENFWTSTTSSKDPTEALISFRLFQGMPKDSRFTHARAVRTVIIGAN
jgi:hypothetical protein